MTKSAVRLLAFVLCFSIVFWGQAPGSPVRAGVARNGVEARGSPVRAGVARNGVEAPGSPARAGVARNGVEAPLAPDAYKNLKYRYIGPVGNRTTAVVGIPGNPWIYYVGAASGGIFKSTDGGIHWEPIFDSQEVSSIGSLALAPSDPNILWAGTGESFVRS